MSSKQIRGSRRFRDYEKPKVEERFDYAELVRRQIERCLLSSGDPEYMFPDNVQALEALIPRELKDEQYTNDFEASHIDGYEYVYMRNCGMKMGSQEDPLVKNDRGDWGLSSETGFTVERDENGEIDWSDPNIVSPKLIPKEDVSWFSRFEAAFNMFVRLGVAVRRISRV